ncbi:TIGR01777 family oxidoreductase [Deinococcus sp. HMF7604]|uniref:TIGR01777 family oxidoreductase n=1 Tax=Deinococcus betulae TaxID=2873312 RepID=UPI001CCAFBD3|nr:TIGR01777 family oxidoreductase [Deinococcus betulae]MBZ9751211.1 TIGR01777 family oxidoreductase [Deinococcus betulae]
MTTPETSVGQRLVIAGGSGFLGRAMTRFFAAQGWEVVILSRSRPQHPLPARWVGWDGVNQGEWARELDGAAALLNLAGRSVNCRYTAANMLDIYASRLDSTRALGRAAAAAASPPPVWLNSSTATIYRDARDRPQDEAAGEQGQGFSVDVAQRWEAAFLEADLPNIRRVALRTAMVYGVGEGGVMETTDRVVRLGGAGPMAGGGQRVSWIHEQDFCRAVAFLIASDLSGPVNVSAPESPTNAEFLRAYRKAWEVPLGVPSTTFLIQLGARVMGSEAELLLKSRWAAPGRLLSAGFTFDFTAWPHAIETLVAQARREGHQGR